jgi:hypothetical protein
MKKVDNKGGTLIDGFPCGGLTIQLHHPYIGDGFTRLSTISMVYDEITNYLARITQTRNSKLPFSSMN